VTDINTTVAAVALVDAPQRELTQRVLCDQFQHASTLNQDLCPWHLLLDPSTQDSSFLIRMPNDDDPVIGTGGPFCVDEYVKLTPCTMPIVSPPVNTPMKSAFLSSMGMQDSFFQACLAFYCSIAS
jgi:hypothetical protein